MPGSSFIGPKIVPKWTAKNISIPIELFKKKSESAIIAALHYIGQEFIKNARNGGDYTDRTGNLRSSIGYGIFKDGKFIESVFQPAGNDQGGKGVQEAKKTAKENASKKGISLVVTAGMNYAAAVEGKGYNVLTLFAPSESQVKRDLEQLLKHV